MTRAGGLENFMGRKVSFLALMWKKLQSDIDVVCLMSSLEFQFVYSSRIKEVAKLGGNISGLAKSAF